MTPGAGIVALLEADGLTEFRELVEAHPEVLGEEVESELREQANQDGPGPFFAAVAQLVQDARTDPGEAWNRYSGVVNRLEDAAREFEPGLRAIAVANDERRFDEVIALCDAALPRAGEAGVGSIFGDLHEWRAGALMNSPSGDRAENIEEAIHSYSEAFRLAVGHEQSALRAMHLGGAFLARIREDRAENIEEGIRLLRIALAELDDQCAAETWAIVRTNLALALFRRQRGERVANLKEAADLCRAALSYRSPERDGFDWAHTQLNLGEILEHLSRLDEARVEEAEEAYLTVIEHADELREEWLLGAAHRSLARIRLRTGKRTPEEHTDAALAGREVADDRELIEDARDHLKAARDLMHDARDPLQLGYVLNELAGVLAELEEFDESIEIGREALQILRPTSAPHECVSVGGRLGDQLAQRDSWPESADAFRDGVAAAELSFQARLETESREQDLSTAGNLARFASFAIARIDEPLEAALVLETGRARELRRRLGPGDAEMERLAALPDEIATAYRSVAAELALAPIGLGGSSEARAFQEVLAAIRRIPGFEDFAAGARKDDLFNAIEPGWPVIYVNPTPYGTVLLRAWRNDGEPAVSAHFFERPIAFEVFLRLLAAEAAATPNPADVEDSSSYLAGISGDDPDRDFHKDLDGVLPWLGEALARPVRDCLAETGATGVTLILSGPVGVAPLHACPWSEGGVEKCLLDEFAVRYAPSAALVSDSLERSRRATDSMAPSLLALGNPGDDLPAAGPEIGELRQHFGADHSQGAEGRDATKRFFASSAEQASHIHLACHARGGLMDSTETGVLLADGFLSAPDLTTLGSLDARLVVVSACQSAMSTITERADEVFSISTVMLAAGSRCAIASLWPVDDASTAILMTRMYEVMFKNNLRPPEALRAAQLWLRDLTFEAEEAFLSQHPLLEAELRRRKADDDLPGRRGGDVSTEAGFEGPYAHPDYWAAFVAVGA